MICYNYVFIQEREPKCPHPCPRPCHPGECDACKALVKRSCHCGSMVHVFECRYFNSLSEKDQLAVRSCGGPCHRLTVLSLSIIFMFWKKITQSLENHSKVSRIGTKYWFSQYGRDSQKKMSIMTEVSVE